MSLHRTFTWHIRSLAHFLKDYKEKVYEKKPVVKIDITTVPQHILYFYKTVTLAIDIMHVNSIPFLVTLSRNIHYGTTTAFSGTNMSGVVLFIQ